MVRWDGGSSRPAPIASAGGGGETIGAPSSQRSAWQWSPAFTRTASGRSGRLWNSSASTNCTPPPLVANSASATTARIGCDALAIMSRQSYRLAHPRQYRGAAVITPGVMSPHMERRETRRPDAQCHARSVGSTSLVSRLSFVRFRPPAGPPPLPSRRTAPASGTPKSAAARTILPRSPARTVAANLSPRRSTTQPATGRGRLRALSS